MPPAHPSLLADMRQALLSEFGALEAYRLLAARTPDAELAELLRGLHEEERSQIGRLSALLSRLGSEPPRGSWRRRWAARLLVLSTPVVGLRFALRLCREAEESVARWYRQYANHLARSGDLEAARECEELRSVKERHARSLGAWISSWRAGS